MNATTERTLPGRFRLLRGNHTERLPTGKMLANGLPERSTTKYRSDGAEAGNIVTSHIDLEKLHNGVSLKKKKFEYLGPAEKGKKQKASPSADSGEDSTEEVEAKVLEELPMSKLREKAKDLEIDIRGLNSKEDIVARIKETIESS